MPERIRAALALTATFVLRFLREGLVLRALVWPGLVCALALVGTAGAYAWFGVSPRVLVSEPELVVPFSEAGFMVEVHSDPAGEIAGGRAWRGVWKEGDTWVFGRASGGRGSFRIEALLRDISGARWRLDIPELEARPTDVDRQARLMAGIIGLFFTLYGVVMGAGSVFRDRGNGCLEGEMALPIPFWAHAAARLLALSVVVVPSFTATLLLIDGLIGISHVADWVLHGGAATLAGGSLGLMATSAPTLDRGFSAPLSRALTVSMAMLTVGWSFPAFGAWLPLASLGAFMHGATPSPVAALGAVLIAALATLRFGRSECL